MPGGIAVNDKTRTLAVADYSNKRIQSGCQRKPGKMLKMSTEEGQQNKFILTS